MKKGDTALSNPLGDQEKYQSEASLKKGQDTSPSTPNKLTTNTTGKKSSTEIGIPIKSLTPLQSIQGNPNVKVTFIEYLTPIYAEEMPPSNLFVNKKRRVIVKREMHQKDGVAFKRHRVLYDSQALDEAKFAMEMAISLEDFSMGNHGSVGSLVEQLKQRNLLVR
jgi:hypothetical protein